MKIDVVRPGELGPEELNAWRAIQADVPRLRSPFLAPEWVQALDAVGGPDARDGRVAVMREGAETVGFFPARVGAFAATAPGAPLCDYQGVVARLEVDVDARDLARALRTPRIDLQNAVADTPPFQPFIQGVSASHLLDLSGGFETYAAGRKAAGSGLLADTAKKMRKMSREVGEIAFARSDSRADWDTAFGWKRAQYRTTRQTDIFATAWVARLLERLRDTADERFGLRFFTLHAGDRLAATHIALQNGPVLHAWFIAHDEELQRYSAGVALIVEILKWAAAHGVTEFDLGPGDYRFKRSLASDTRQLGYGLVGRPSPSTAGRWAQFRVRRAAEALPLGRFSHLPGKAMRRVDLWRGLSGA